MAEYIEREALMAHLEERREYLFKENGDYDHYSNGFDEAVGKVENFPAADAVEVVRCRDCKHYDKRSDYCEEMGFSCLPHDFCSYGERSESYEV